ncbi:MAG: hypothetical protein IJM23_07790 [Lachnospiraceae bacterium]|nr:hypothetical protein [Lachnospiraceae bacterium]
MTQMKEQAVKMIHDIPDDKMIFVLGILQDLAALTEEHQTEDEDFFSLAGNIDIDAEAVEELRAVSMV